MRKGERFPEPELDSTLVLLIRYSKTAARDIPVTWESVREVLKPEYSEHMKFRDVFNILTRSYMLAINEPRFQMGDQTRLIEELLLAPIVGFSSIDSLLKPCKLETEYSVEDYYNSMVRTMISGLMLTRQDWCRDQLKLDEGK